ncbi:AraC-type DNA-binding protein [Flagellimonas taeanensis]|uniref:AraC-type DNA-binding protein n=1 Tax=Flagellimonas taeanensis TaxID=1005926 RepID=A0A1M6UI23_9FLAO|nr:AraC family transcriptional regulator [Allomuricauda taeanensis]SFC56051.1 AraC-type DNA-binding protein [Allomuricauda taeanensis]SHK68811.1 transcriptional regulator, AraC family [Allomuricauda taeanensis]
METSVRQREVVSPYGNKGNVEPRNNDVNMVSLRTFREYKDIDLPKRLMKYILIWCSQGQATVVVDEKQLEVQGNSVLTITSGQIHYFKDFTNAQGYILEFTLDFFCKTDSDIELIFQNGLFCHFAMNEVIPLRDYRFLEEQMQSIGTEIKEEPHQHLISIHSRIELILVEINRSKIERGDEIWRPDALFLKFLELVRSSFQHNYPVSRYAELLETTEAKLNEQAKLHAGKTAQNVIYGLTVSEAKRLLTYEKLIVKEVAYKLGFADPFYFSNFFKKHAGKSPKAYQADHAL